MTFEKVPGISERGGIGIRVVFAIVTLLVIGVALGMMLKTSQQRQQENHRKAEQISLYGMQTALEKLGTDASWESGFEKVPYDGGWYSVTVRRYKEGDTKMLELKADGHIGKAVYTTAGLFAWADSVWVPRGLH
jgi:hypothetical protein